MNPELPPDNRAELEAKVTALLLGELTAEEAAALRQTISQDAALAQLHQRLKLTLDLVRETAATSAGELSKQPAPLKLSPARREALLAHFKTVAPKEFARPRARKISRLVEWAAVAVILIMAAGVVLPKLASTSKYEGRLIAGREIGFWERFVNKPDVAKPSAETMTARVSENLARQATPRFPDAPREHMPSKGDFAARAGTNLSRSVSEGWVAAPTTAANPFGNNFPSWLGVVAYNSSNSTANTVSPAASPPKTPIYMGKTEESAEIGPAEHGVTLNLRGVSADKALDFLSESAGLTVNRQAGTQVGGTVDLVSEKPPNKDETVALYNKVLADHGLTAIQDKNTLTVMRLEEAQKNAGTPVSLGMSAQSIPQDQVVTEVIPVRSLSPTEAVKDLSTLLPQGARMDANEGGNALIMTGRQDDIRRMAQTIAALDSSGGGAGGYESSKRATLATLDRTMSDGDLADAIKKLNPVAGGPSGRTNALYDDNTVAGDSVSGGVYSWNGVGLPPTNGTQPQLADDYAFQMRMQQGAQQQSTTSSTSPGGIGGRGGAGGFGGGGIGGGVFVGEFGGGGQGSVTYPAGTNSLAGTVIESIQGAGGDVLALNDGNRVSGATPPGGRATRGGRGGAGGGGRRGGGGGGGGGGFGGGGASLPNAVSAPPVTISPDTAIDPAMRARLLAREAEENGNVTATPTDRSGAYNQNVGRNSSIDSNVVINFGFLAGTTNNVVSIDRTAPTQLEEKETAQTAAAGRLAAEKVLAEEKAKMETALATARSRVDSFGTAQLVANGKRMAGEESLATEQTKKALTDAEGRATHNAGTIFLPADVDQIAPAASDGVLARSLRKPAQVAAELVPQSQSAAAPSGVPVLGETALVGNLFKGEAEAAPAASAATVAPAATPAQVDRLAVRRQAAAPAAPAAAPTPQHEFSRRFAAEAALQEADAAPRKPAVPPPTPQPEVQTRDNAFSTFSLNVSDVSFKLAAASLQNGSLPDAATVRSEEFINAFDYRDPEPARSAAIAFAWERAGWPFSHNRDLLRFSVKTAAQGRQAGRPLNLVLLLDKSGSMERADRVAIIREALRVLATQLQPQDKLSVVVFARTARLWADGVSGSQAGELADALEALTPEGGTNLEEAMRLAYEAVFRHYLANGENRVVLLTDGAANLGDVDPENLKKKVEASRTQGIALDCFGVGWEDYNDTLLEVLSRAGGGRYGFINTPEEAATGFAGQLAGALRVAASDVKVQVEFNPARVTSWRQIGYAKDQLKKEQFRDNTVKAAQIGAAESGNALYTVELNPAGEGPVCTVYVRYRAPGTTAYYEHAWAVPYDGAAAPLDQASPAMRLAATATAFSEWLATSPYAGGVALDQLLGYMRGVPEIYGADARPKLLETMLREAKSISGK